MGGVAAERVCHGLDRRKDGQITWTEFTAAAMWYVARALKPPKSLKKDAQKVLGSLFRGRGRPFEHGFRPAFRCF